MAARTSFAAAIILLALESTARAHYERCTIYQGQDTCLAGDACSVQDGGAGICVPPPCDGDVDCVKPPLRRCDKRPATPVCVECFADTECGAPLICELDPRSYVSNRCVECAVGRVEACSSGTRGRVCVFERGTCGCVDHPDCPPTHFCKRGDCVARPTAGGQPDVEAGVPDASVDADAGSSSVVTPASGGCAMSRARHDSALVMLILSAVALRRRAGSSGRARRRTAGP